MTTGIPGAHGLSGLGDPGMEATTEPRLVRISGMLNDKVEALSSLISRLEGLKNRLVGATPPSPTTEKGPDMPINSLVERLEAQLGTISSSLIYLEEIINDLERVC